MKKYLSMAVGIILMPLVLVAGLIWMASLEIADWWGIVREHLVKPEAKNMRRGQ